MELYGIVVAYVDDILRGVENCATSPSLPQLEPLRYAFEDEATTEKYMKRAEGCGNIVVGFQPYTARPSMCRLLAWSTRLAL
eukprot:5470759-Amphidinium_carterae.2